MAQLPISLVEGAVDMVSKRPGLFPKERRILWIAHKGSLNSLSFGEVSVQNGLRKRIRLPEGDEGSHSGNLPVR